MDKIDDMNEINNADAVDNIKEIQTNEELMPQKKETNQGIDFNNYKFTISMFFIII